MIAGHVQALVAQLVLLVALLATVGAIDARAQSGDQLSDLQAQASRLYGQGKYADEHDEGAPASAPLAENNPAPIEMSTRPWVPADHAGYELKGYGNLVLIRHSDGWVSAYGHADRILVKRDDVVQRGQVIAKAGKTGTVDQVQLHFELRQGAKPVDPLPLLER